MSPFPLKAILHCSVFNSSTDIASQLVTVRAQLAALQHRYDALHADRDRLAHELEENMRKYKRFKRWVFVTKLKVPAKDGAADQVDATPTIKMLETPITHRSKLPFFAHFLATRMHLNVFRQNHPARYYDHAPQLNLSLLVARAGVPCHPADASSTLPRTLRFHHL